ncbi:hypothetical protein Pfo_010383 [Paulownia fortunei]|nr:hypothetical protein Pfo_010383 [Paulownia fortunei]
MAKRSARIQQLREKSELSCMWGLFSILHSCQGRASPKLISNGRPVNRHIIDFSRKLDQLASFDKECRKIQNEADLASITVDASKRGVRNHLLKTQKSARKKSQKAYQSSLCNLNNTESLIHQQPSTSAEICLNKLTIAAALGTVCTQNLWEEIRLSEGFGGSIRLGKHDQVDEKIMQQAQMRAKAFVDQMFVDRKSICKEGTSTDSKPFSDALEVLNTNKYLFMELLPEPDSQLERCNKNFHPSQTEEETVKLVPDAKFSKCESKDASCSEKPGCTLATHKRNMKNQFLEKINYQCQYSSKTSFTAQASNRIVILKPVPQNGKYSGNIVCHCLSRKSHQKLSSRVSNGKPTSFSVREIKKKLKHTFGATIKEPNQYSRDGTSHKLSHNRSIFGDDCNCRGVDTRGPLNASNNAKTKEKLGKKLDHKSDRGPDIACVTETVRKKIDFSSVGFSKKQEVDVVLEAKGHLSARLKNLNAPTSKRSPQTLGRILTSPEHDFWPLSPRRDSQYCSGSAQMRFSPYNTSPTPNARQRTCLSPLRTNKEVTSCDDTIEILSTETSSSLIRSTDEEEHDIVISATGNMKSNGEPKMVEINNIHHSKVPSGINSTDVTSTMQRTDTIQSHEEDCSVMHSILDSLSENETFTSTVDDLPSTPTSIYQLDMPESIKHQEHRSPVSVLEQFFAEDVNSPSSIMLQTARQRQRLQPLRLQFEECSFESSPKIYQPVQMPA